ncbi:hypothetical protein FOZ63_022477, partial [Perkinsus olseni]
QGGGYGAFDTVHSTRSSARGGGRCRTRGTVGRAKWPPSRAAAACGPGEDGSCSPVARGLGRSNARVSRTGLCGSTVGFEGLHHPVEQERALPRGLRAASHDTQTGQAGSPASYCS